MVITKKSPISGITHTKILNITEEQLTNWYSGTLIQNAMPHLSPGDREFLMTGITEEEWDSLFSQEE